KLASVGRYTRLRELTVKVVGGATLISIPIAFLLYLLGKPAMSLLFQHGAFTRHASSLTALALLGYAFGLPGRIASDLLIRSFYAIRNAVTPLITNMLAFAIRIGLLLLLLRLLTGKYAILAIPLAVGGATTIEAGVLLLLLFFHF